MIDSVYYKCIIYQRGSGRERGMIHPKQVWKRELPPNTQLTSPFVVYHTHVFCTCASLPLPPFPPQADVNKADEDGATPLYMAADGGHTDTVALLITTGEADATLTCQGYSPLMAAKEEGHQAIVALLEE